MSIAFPFLRPNPSRRTYKDCRRMKSNICNLREDCRLCCSKYTFVAKGVQMFCNIFVAWVSKFWFNVSHGKSGRNLASSMIRLSNRIKKLDGFLRWHLLDIVCVLIFPAPGRWSFFPVPNRDFCNSQSAQTSGSSRHQRHILTFTSCKDSVRNDTVQQRGRSGPLLEVPGAWRRICCTVGAIVVDGWSRRRLYTSLQKKKHADHSDIRHQPSWLVLAIMVRSIFWGLEVAQQECLRSSHHLRFLGRLIEVVECCRHLQNVCKNSFCCTVCFCVQMTCPQQQLFVSAFLLCLSELMADLGKCKGCASLWTRFRDQGGDQGVL